MSEKSSPDTSRRLPNVYNSPDQTIDEVGSRPSPLQETVRRNPGPRSRKFSAVTRVVIDQALMSHATELADGDLGRLVPRVDGSVIVANNRAQAHRILGNLAFGAVNQSETATYPAELPLNTRM